MFLLLRIHFESLVEGKWVDLLQDGFESDQRLLENLVPVVLSKVDDNGNQHWEGSLLVVLKDIQEVIILEEAHGSISNLKMDTADALYDPLKKPRNKKFYFIDLTYFENFLKFSEEKCLFNAVSKWPILKQTF